MDPAAPVITLALADPRARDAAVVGSKAARLAELLADGFHVPDGVVVPVGDADAGVAAAEAVDRLGGGPLAVRSSAVAEDRADASFAGMYESVLGVRGADEVAAAISRVVGSARSDRVSGYSADAGGGIAVLIQPLVDADLAGVALTADPLTGARDVVHVTAVAGLGEALVSGAADGETWEVRADGATCPHGAVAEGRAGVLDARTAREVAALARRVEAGAGSPQDIEWAIAGGEVHLLQARPMTALPDVADWTVARGGHWRRDVRLAEWLSGPVSPSFATWFLPEWEAGFNEEIERQYPGCALETPMHVLVNGWYFTNFGRPASPVRMVARNPSMMARQMRAVAKLRSDARPLERIQAQPAFEAFTSELQPRYVAAIEQARSRLAAGDDLAGALTDLVRTAGALMLTMVEALGFAAKAEYALASFYGRHLRDAIGGSHAVLVSGLQRPAPAPPHALVSADWAVPTLGELGVASTSADRFGEAVAAREACEAAARGALSGKRLAQFESVLEVAQRWAPRRERLAVDLTAGWPVMRALLLGLGDDLVSRGVIATRADVFMLEREEIASASRPLTKVVIERRARVERQSRLVPPISIGGRPPIQVRMLAKDLESFRSEAIADEHLLVGIPAAAGVATGPARIVRDIADFDRVQSGDVLVAPATAPAWTPLFGRIAAVVTDTGSLAAHASLIAREYGLPAVAATGHGTSRLRDGQLVRVDGGCGVVDAV